MKLSQMIRNLWIYRRLIALAVVLGIATGFVFFNQQEVDVKFPLLGEFRSSTGIVMLLSAALGGAGTWLVMTFRNTLRQAREKQIGAEKSGSVAQHAESAHEAAKTGDDERRKLSSGAGGDSSGAEQAPRSVTGGKEVDG